MLFERLDLVFIYLCRLEIQRLCGLLHQGLIVLDYLSAAACKQPDNLINPSVILIL